MEIRGYHKPALIIVLSYTMQENNFQTMTPSLRKTLAQMDLIIANIKDSVVVINPDKTIVFANDSFANLVQEERISIVGKNVWEVLTLFKAGRAVYKEYNSPAFSLHEIASIGGICNLESKGASRIVEIKAVYIDKIDEAMIVVNDITEIKKSEEIVRLQTSELQNKVRLVTESNTYLERIKTASLNLLDDLNAAKAELEEGKLKDEAIFSSIDDGMIVIDKGGRIMLTNKRAEDMLLYEKEDLIGKQIDEIIPMQYETGDILRKEDRPFRRALTEKKRITISPLTDRLKTYFLLRKDGTRFPIEIVSSPILLGGDVLGIIDIFRDITSEIEVDKVKTEFVSIASHQLRTPLSTIKWYSEILISGDAGELNDTQKGYIKEIYHGNERMIDLVNALLNVSRLEVGAFIVEVKQVDLVDVARIVIEELKSQIDVKKIDLIENYQPNLPFVNADQGLVRIIFQNLLSNAVKYTSEKGKVGIQISYADKEISIKVWDTGIGIPRTNHNKIFTKLFRADNAREVDPDGTGLGLYIIKSIIAQTNGKIWFESSEGKGTAFYITIPVNWMEPKSGTRKLA